ncbi:MAG: hypothetical protein QXI12_06640 [Candidatus Methanomethyliaceae archaeon]
MWDKIKDWWNNLPHWGKIGFVVAIVAIIIYAIYRWRQNAASGNSYLPVSSGLPVGTGASGGSGDNGNSNGQNTAITTALTNLGNSIAQLATQEQNDVAGLQQGLEQTNTQIGQSLAGLAQAQQQTAGQFAQSIAQIEQQNQQAISQALSPLQQTLNSLQTRLASYTQNATMPEGASTMGENVGPYSIQQLEAGGMNINTQTNQISGTWTNQTAQAFGFANAAAAQQQANLSATIANITNTQGEQAAINYAESQGFQFNSPAMQ